MTVPEAANHFTVHISTIRSWIRHGCPCLEEGSVGRGHGARLDPQAVERWLVARRLPTLAAQADQDVLAIMATALYDALKRDGLMGQTRAAEYVVLMIYKRIYLNVTQEQLQLKDVPDELKRISFNYLDSVERG